MPFSDAKAGFALINVSFTCLAVPHSSKFSVVIMSTGHGLRCSKIMDDEEVEQDIVF